MLLFFSNISAEKDSDIFEEIASKFVDFSIELQEI